ncbi:hypothetical protein DV736_g6084, partial [Chaetothyriales sp. CBS 134916]
MTTPPQLRVLFFDVFGTCVAQRTPVADELWRAAREALESDVSAISSGVRTKATQMSYEHWVELGVEWNTEGDKFVRGSIAKHGIVDWRAVDKHRIELLPKLLAQRGLIIPRKDPSATSELQVADGSLWDELQLKHLGLVWHRLPAWPDTCRGLDLLNRQFSSVTLSNSYNDLLEDLVAQAHMPFTHIYSADMFQSFKPNPTVYLGAAEKMGVKPEECALVAAHLSDLKGAKACGFYAIYVERPLEEKNPELGEEDIPDMRIKEDEDGFVALAERLLGIQVGADDFQQQDDSTPTANEAAVKAESRGNGRAFVEPFVVDADDVLFEMYKDVLGRFDEPEQQDAGAKEPAKPAVFYDDDDDVPDEEEMKAAAAPKVGKKKLKKMTMLSIAELKAMVKKPELVEWTDPSAPDPRLLVHLKASKNVVPVPGHWSLKREYLSSKRGIEKPPFALPKFIQETGIAEMRDAVLEKQSEATLKQRQRERVQPRMGKLDIDYQKLYEAFFRFQTKPALTRYGEVYYEGKEFETNLKHLRPGELSDELTEALNMPAGAPPPWLINMQRYGPPPSYPALKVPGVNAPPPPGASWGFGPGQWGKPPVDEATNRPLYGGDIFGVLQQQQNTQQGEPVERELVAGTETPGGMTSAMPSELGGTETISEFDLRKRRGTDTEETTGPRSAYQVIPERQTRVEGFFGGDRAYDLSGGHHNLPVLGQDDNRKRKRAGDVDVSMNPDALQAQDGMSKEDLQKAYDQQRKAEQNPGWDFQEDLSDMIAAESRKRLKKDEEKRSSRR